MLQSLFEWLTEWLAEGLDTLTDGFLGMLQPSLQEFVNTFPIFAESYSVFQTIGYAIAAIIAVFGLYQFFFAGGASGRQTQSPWQILFWAGAAAAAVAGSGLACSWCVQIAKSAFDMFLNMNAAGTATGETASTTFVNFATTFHNWVSIGSTVSDGAQALMIMLLDIAIGWEIIKLMVEVVERYLMVGVLTYTAPLVMSTIASDATRHIFKKWAGMFISSCFLMSLSVLFLKACISGLTNIQADSSFIISLLMVLAMARIGQRIDSYMSSLGLNAAQTGGGLLEDVFAATKGAAAAVNGIKNAAGPNSVLGRAMSHTPVGATAMGAGRAVKSAAGAIAKGGSMSDAVSAAQQSARNSFRSSVVGRAVEGADTARAAGKQGTAVAAGAAGGAAKGVADNAVHTFTGQKPIENAENAAAKKNFLDAEDTAAYNADNMAAQTEHKDISADAQERMESGRWTNEDENDSFKNAGTADSSGGVLEVDSDGNVQPGINAEAAGIAVEGAGDEQRMTGDSEKVDNAVQQFIANESDAVKLDESGAMAAAAQDIGGDVAERYDPNPDKFQTACEAQAVRDMRAETMPEYGSDGSMTFAQAEAIANDPKAVEEGGAYNNRAREELRTDTGTGYGDGSMTFAQAEERANDPNSAESGGYYSYKAAEETAKQKLRNSKDTGYGTDGSLTFTQAESYSANPKAAEQGGYYHNLARQANPDADEESVHSAADSMQAADRAAVSSAVSAKTSEIGADPESPYRDAIRGRAEQLRNQDKASVDAAARTAAQSIQSSDRASLEKAVSDRGSSIRAADTAMIEGRMYSQRPGSAQTSAAARTVANTINSGTAQSARNDFQSIPLEAGRTVRMDDSVGAAIIRRSGYSGSVTDMAPGTSFRNVSISGYANPQRTEQTGRVMTATYTNTSGKDCTVTIADEIAKLNGNQAAINGTAVSFTGTGYNGKTQIQQTVYISTKENPQPHRAMPNLAADVIKNPNPTEARSRYFPDGDISGQGQAQTPRRTNRNSSRRRRQW